MKPTWSIQVDYLLKENHKIEFSGDGGKTVNIHASTPKVRVRTSTHCAHMSDGYLCFFFAFFMRYLTFK